VVEQLSPPQNETALLGTLAGEGALCFYRRCKFGDGPDQKQEEDLCLVSNDRFHLVVSKPSLPPPSAFLTASPCALLVQCRRGGLSRIGGSA